jgi:hypothetical protein
MASTETYRTVSFSFLKEIPRLVLIALFAFAAVDKVIHFGGFVNAVHSYAVLPTQLERSAAIFFIMAEFIIAFGLVTKRWRRTACLAAVFLLGLFTVVYLAVNPEGVCGCWFTLTLNSGGYFHILQNVVFIGLAILTWLDSKALSSKDSSGPFADRHSTAAPDYLGTLSATSNLEEGR